MKCSLRLVRFESGLCDFNACCMLVLAPDSFQCSLALGEYLHHYDQNTMRTPKDCLEVVIA